MQVSSDIITFFDGAGKVRGHLLGELDFQVVGRHEVGGGFDGGIEQFHGLLLAVLSDDVGLAKGLGVPGDGGSGVTKR